MSWALLSSGRLTKIVRVTHHQGDLRYGVTAGIQCSCMSLMSVYWNTFIAVTTWDGTDLDVEDRLFKSLNRYRLLGVDDLPRTVNIYSHSVTLNAYLISLREIIESCLNTGSGALLMISGYIFGIIWGKHRVYLFTYLILMAGIMKVIFLKMEELFWSKLKLWMTCRIT